MTSDTNYITSKIMFLFTHFMCVNVKNNSKSGDKKKERKGKKMDHISENKYSIKYKYSVTILPFLVGSYLLILLCVGVFYWRSLSSSADMQKVTLLSIASTVLDENLKAIPKTH